MASYVVAIWLRTVRISWVTLVFSPTSVWAYLDDNVRSGSWESFTTIGTRPYIVNKRVSNEKQNENINLLFGSELRKNIVFSEQIKT